MKDGAVAWLAVGILGGGMLAGLGLVYLVTTAAVRRGLNSVYSSLDEIRGALDKHTHEPAHPYVREAVATLRLELDDHKATSRSRWDNDDRRWATEHRRLSTVEERVTALEKPDDEGTDAT